VLDAYVAVPADDAGRNLVAEREGENRRMIRELGHLSDECAPNVTRQAAVVEKRRVLGPRESDEYAQIVLDRLVQQRLRRRRVRADRVDAEGRHHAEVVGNLSGARELAPFRVRGERAVRHTLDEETLGAQA